MIKFLRSLPRHLISAFVSLVRNFAMTFSAVSAVTITLLLLSIFMVLIGNINNLSNKIQKDLKIHVVLNTNVVNEEEINQIETTIRNLEGVSEVEFSNKDQELQYMIEERGEELRMYEDDNPLAHAFYVKVENGEKIGYIAKTIESMEWVFACQYGGNSVEQLVKTLNYVKLGGVGFLLLLLLLVLFLIHSTIKMTIQARSMEITIMRQVGAANWYIKIPFLIEGMIIGALGAIVPCICSYYGYQFILEKTGGHIITSTFQLIALEPFIYILITTIIVIGVIVGLLGSAISTTKYLRFKR